MAHYSTLNPLNRQSPGVQWCYFFLADFFGKMSSLIFRSATFISLSLYQVNTKDVFYRIRYVRVYQIIVFAKKKLFVYKTPFPSSKIKMFKNES